MITHDNWDILRFSYNFSEVGQLYQLHGIFHNIFVHLSLLDLQSVSKIEGFVFPGSYRQRILFPCEVYKMTKIVYYYNVSWSALDLACRPIWSGDIFTCLGLRNTTKNRSEKPTTKCRKWKWVKKKKKTLCYLYHEVLLQHCNCNFLVSPYTDPVITHPVLTSIVNCVHMTRTRNCR